MGQGKTIILLHGFGESFANWLSIAEELQTEYRVVIPNISTLYAQKDPLTFTQQVDLLAQWLELVIPPGESFHLVGMSYGGLLSFALRSKSQAPIQSHTLINPMPMEPTKFLKSWRLRQLLYVSRWPGVLNFLRLTPWGKSTFKYLGTVFHMGFRGKKVIHIFNQRKFLIIYKALKRFLWISANEDWSYWKSIKHKDRIYTQLIYSEKDSLFSATQYLKICSQFQEARVKSIKGAGHLVVESHYKEVLMILKNVFLDSENMQTHNIAS